MKTPKAGRILTALVFASMIGGISVGTAQADDNNWRRDQQNRNDHDRDWRNNNGWHGNNGWHDNGGWRDNRGGCHSYQPVYAPPPVVYGPTPSPGIHLFFPFLW